MAVVGRLLVGLGVATVYVSTLKIMAEWFHPREFVQMAGILVAMGGLGSLSAATPLVWLNTSIGWRGSFFAVGAVTLILAALVWLVVRDRPENMGWTSPAGEQRARQTSPRLFQGVGAVLMFPHFWPLALWMLLICGIYFSFAGLWGGPYLMHVHKLSQAQAGRILALLSMGTVLGGPVLCAIAQRVVRRRKPVLIGANVLVVGATAMLAFRTASVPVWGLYAIYLIIGVFAGTAGVLAVTINKENYPVRMAGTATGLMNLFPFAGGGIMQPLLGYLLERNGTVDGAFTTAGYSQAFLVFFAAAAFSLPLALLFREQRLGGKAS
jgi:sugar phosphate permease